LLVRTAALELTRRSSTIGADYRRPQAGASSGLAGRSLTSVVRSSFTAMVVSSILFADFLRTLDLRPEVTMGFDRIRHSRVTS
jgi:hypothetical protein